MPVELGSSVVDSISVMGQDPWLEVLNPRLRGT
jgi:hypothetical protein